MHDYFIIYKPFQVLSQFTSGAAGDETTGGKQTLKDFFSVPSDVYPVGRLDYDSEGLLILTNDKKLNHRLLSPAFQHEREYWVQVEGMMDDEAISRLQNGIVITVDGKPFHCSKCIARRFTEEPAVHPRNPPIRFRKNISTSWISIVLTEGKNRQVRKMTAATGYPTLRLIRYRVESVTIDGLRPGEMKRVSEKDLYAQLFSVKRSR